jgi:hypothetical protein
MEHRISLHVCVEWIPMTFPRPSKQPPTLMQRYGIDVAAPKPPPAAETPTPETPAAETPKTPAAGTMLVDAALSALSDLNYAAMRTYVDRSLNMGGSGLDPEQTTTLSGWNERLFAWSLDHVEVVRQARREDAAEGRMAEVVLWLDLQDDMRRALAMRRRDA